MRHPNSNESNSDNTNPSQATPRRLRQLSVRPILGAIALGGLVGGLLIHTGAISLGQHSPALGDLNRIPANHPQLDRLVEFGDRYGCPIRYADGSPIFRRPLQRQELIEAVETCVEVLNQQNLWSQLSDAESELLETLDREFGIFNLLASGDAADDGSSIRESSPAGPEPALSTLQNAPAQYGTGGIGSRSAPTYPPGYNREEYNPIAENRFLSVRSNPLSTFSIDVDSAAYSNVRRFLRNGQRPPVDAVRIEELINYFSYDYPEPDGDEPFSLITEVSAAPWNPQHQLVHIGLQGQSIPSDDLPPANLVFLLDVSGSMNFPDKLPLLKSAFSLLVNELDEDDTVSIVVYAGAAGVVLEPTPGNENDAILDAIAQLEAGGSTAGGEGVQLAYQLAREQFIEDGNNRVILATDGDFNVGTSSEAGLVRLIEQERDNDIFLTVLGFGTGNLQDAKMEQLANHGNGNYAYIDSVMEARKVLVNEMGATLLTLAKDVKIQVEFNPAKVQAYRLIGYENRLLADEDFNDDSQDAGELGAGHSVTALYEVIPVGVESEVELPEVDDLRYQTSADGDNLDLDAETAEEMMLVKLRYKDPTAETSQRIDRPVRDRPVSLSQTSDDFRFAAAVAAFGLWLRESEFRGQSDLTLARELAQDALGGDRHGYRAEFLELLELARVAD
ncbi:MAG: VWA domain-containing protein [Sodalinema sp.]|uniref:vWA domain-containing protein n=1 Tax=Sodalinema sp. TaxID=3080550 RepID=UPI001220AC36|nr:MAG: VWA domain-containing protein [Phormidium sp. SL48-SHIP]